MSDYIHYAPGAIAEGQEEPLFAYNDSMTLEDAMRSFDVWQDRHHFRLTKCWVDVYRNGSKIHTINLKRTWVPDTIEVPGEAAIPYIADFGLTLREIVAQRVPQAVAVSDVPGGVVGCPSAYSFLNSSHDLRPNGSDSCCSRTHCEECWNQTFKG